jgi:hypothetical protein
MEKGSSVSLIEKIFKIGTSHEFRVHMRPFSHELWSLLVTEITISINPFMELRKRSRVC